MCGALTIGIAAAQEPNRAAEECLEQFVSGDQQFEVKEPSGGNNDDENENNDDENENNEDQNNEDQNNEDQNDENNEDQNNEEDQNDENNEEQNKDEDQDDGDDGDKRNAGGMTRYLSADVAAGEQQQEDQQQEDQQQEDEEQNNQEDQEDEEQNDEEQNDEEQNNEEQNNEDENADEDDCNQIIADEAQKAKDAFDPSNEKFDNGEGQLLTYEQTFPEDAAEAPDDAEEILDKDLDDVKQIVEDRDENLGRNPDGEFRNECRLSHRNTDNSFVAPGVVDAAQHVHDYYGNGTQNAFSTKENLLADNESEDCAQPEDVSSYVWPGITRGGENNEVIDPGTVQFQFRGYDADVGEVAPMPRGLVLVTGAAKNLNPAESAAKWACTGSENETSVDFPTCEGGSQLVRISDFPSCWDGENLDSADHKTHVVFPEDNGECPESNEVPLPRLRMRAVYPLSGNPDAFFLSSFPESLGLAVSDHFDALNLWPSDLMKKGVDCINRGQNCGVVD